MSRDEQLKKTVSNIGLHTSGLFVYYLCQWLITVAVVRQAGYGDAGILSLTISVCNIFGFVSLFGVRNFQICDVNEQYSNGEYVASRILTTAISLPPFFILLLLRGYEKRTVICCVLYMAFKCMEAFSDVFFGVMQRQGHYKQITVSYLFKGILPLGAFWLLLRTEAGLLGAIGGMEGLYLLVMLCFDMLMLRDSGFLRLRFSRLKPMIVACFPLMLSCVFSAVMIYLPREFVDRYLGREALGYFGTISMVIVVFSTLATSVWGVITPRISFLLKKKDWVGLRKILQWIGGGYIMAFGIVMVIGRLLGPWAFSLVYDMGILPYMYLLSPMLFASMLLLGVSFFDGLFTALEKRTALLCCNVAGVIICAVLAAVLTARTGMIGASISLIAGYGFRLVLLLWLSNRYLRLHLESDS